MLASKGAQNKNTRPHTRSTKLKGLNVDAPSFTPLDTASATTPQTNPAPMSDSQSPTDADTASGATPQPHPTPTSNSQNHTDSLITEEVIPNSIDSTSRDISDMIDSALSSTPDLTDQISLESELIALRVQADGMGKENASLNVAMQLLSEEMDNYKKKFKRTKAGDKTS